MDQIPDLFSQLFSSVTKVGILVIIPLGVTAGVTYWLVRIFQRRWLAQNTNEQLLQSSFPPALTAIGAASFYTFGAVTGLFVGASRNSVLDGTLPLIIAIVTVFITYLTDKSNDGVAKRAYMICLVCFFMGAAFGATYGAELRPH